MVSPHSLRCREHYYYYQLLDFLSFQLAPKVLSQMLLLTPASNSTAADLGQSKESSWNQMPLLHDVQRGVTVVVPPGSVEAMLN